MRHAPAHLAGIHVHPGSALRGRLAPLAGASCAPCRLPAAGSQPDARRSLLQPAAPRAQVVPGELTIVTGVPNSGKSEWIDALLANLAEQHDWCFALCSMEKKVGTRAAGVAQGLVWPGECIPASLHVKTPPLHRVSVPSWPRCWECNSGAAHRVATRAGLPAALRAPPAAHAGHRPRAPASGEVHWQAVLRPALRARRAAHERARAGRGARLDRRPFPPGQVGAPADARYWGVLRRAGRGMLEGPGSEGWARGQAWIPAW